MNIKEYEELFGSYDKVYEEQMENSDDVISSYATKEECEIFLEKYKNEAKKKRELEELKRKEQEKLRREQEEIEESKWKKIEVTFELEADERYCYYDNKASLVLYVNKNWSEKRIINYVKKHMWTSVCGADDYDW